MNTTVVIGPFRLQGANAMHNDLCQGIVAPSALAGFGHAKERELAQEKAPLSLLGTGIIVHDYEIPQGQAKLPLSGSDLRSGKGAASIVAARTAHATISLVLELAPRADPEEVSADGLKDAAKFLASTCAGGRLGGGVLHPIYQGRFRTTFGIANDRHELRDLLRKSPGGWILKDRHDLLVDLSKQFDDPINALLHALVAVPIDEDERVKAEANSKARIMRKRNVPGVVVPIAVGYAAIERPKARRTLRSPKGEYLHAYAESVTSLGEYVHLGRSLRQEGADIFENALWRYRPEGQALFVARGA
jgi:CRISPR type I-F-associated protein Csy2